MRLRINPMRELPCKNATLYIVRHMGSLHNF
jgi:hypothetical protein